MFEEANKYPTVSTQLQQDPDHDASASGAAGGGVHERDDSDGREATLVQHMPLPAGPALCRRLHWDAAERGAVE